MTSLLLLVQRSRQRCCRSAPPQSRRGAISVLSAALMVVMLAAVAFAVDLGMICLAKTELQRSADAAALAATNELLFQLQQDPRSQTSVAESTSRVVRRSARSTARLNQVFRASPKLDLNTFNNENGQVVIGQMVRSADNSAALSFDDPSQINSVQVRVERTAEQNGELPLFFGRIFGLDSVAASAQAQAAFLRSFKGFRVPSGGGDPPPTLMFLPFAVSNTTWQGAIAGGGADNLGWDSEDKRVTHRGDGITDVNLFPLDVSAGGNFGTVDIGGTNSTTPTLRRQIVNGLTRQDLEFHGGALELGDSGTLTLSGDPGQKLGAIQPELQQIIGQPRIIPLYSSVSGSGNQAQYTVVGFAGCRVLDAQLTGSNRRLIIQPASMITRGGIQGQSGTSSNIYSPIVLVK